MKKGIKFAFVLVIVVGICVSFKEIIPDIIVQMEHISALTLGVVCLSSLIYELIEALITYKFAVIYQPKFTYKMALQCVFIASFYRLATFGSAGGVAAIHYFKEQGIPVPSGTGIYTFQYAMHKGAVALFSFIMCIICFPFIYAHYNQYGWLLVLGYILMLLITIGLILFCCSKKLHRQMLWIVDRLPFLNKISIKKIQIKTQCENMEETTKNILRNHWFLFIIVILNLIKHFFWFVIPFLYLQSVTKTSFVNVLGTTTLGIVLASVIPTPVGIGGLEYILTKLLSVQVEMTYAAVSVLIYRFATFVFPFLLGAIVVLMKRKFLRD